MAHGIWVPGVETCLWNSSFDGPHSFFFLVEQGTFGSIRKLIDQFQRNTVSEPVPAPVRMSWGYEKNNGMVVSQSHLSVTRTNISATRTNISSVISRSIDTLNHHAYAVTIDAFSSSFLIPFTSITFMTLRPKLRQVICK